MENRREPATRPAYLLAAALIWTAIVATVLAGPAPKPTHMAAALDCRR